MLGWLLNLINPLKFAVDSLERAHARKLQADGAQAKIDAEVNIDFWRRRVEALNASVSDPWYSPRTIMGWSVAAYVFKIIVWDTVLGLGVTPNPGQQVTFIVMTVIGFYFVSKGAETIANTIANGIARRNS